jgi:hypothetical protein
MDRIVVTSDEVAKIDVQVTAESAPQSPEAGVPLWARIATSVLVLFWPVLAVVTIVLRAVFRGRASRERSQWTSWLCTLLIISSFIAVAQVSVLLYQYPAGVPVSSGSSDLDEKDIFPLLPAQQPMTASELGATLKPMVMVVSPEARAWFHREPQPSGMLGAAVLLHADSNGYLFATAKHVADSASGKMGSAEPATSPCRSARDCPTPRHSRRCCKNASVGDENDRQHSTALTACYGFMRHEDCHFLTPIRGAQFD